MPTEDEVRYWHTTTAGTGIETGAGYRPGVSSAPEDASDFGSAFHPERNPNGEKPLHGGTRRKLYPKEVITGPATKANLGDPHLYVHERMNTALWSSVLEGMPFKEEEAAVNSNYLGPALGDLNKYVDERVGTVVSSSSVDKVASELRRSLPPPGRPGSRSGSDISRASRASSRVSKVDSDLQKIEALKARIAEEEKRRKVVEGKLKLGKSASAKKALENVAEYLSAGKNA
jgi:hypothetical protein